MKERFLNVDQQCSDPPQFHRKLVAKLIGLFFLQQFSRMLTAVICPDA